MEIDYRVKKNIIIGIIITVVIISIPLYLVITKNITSRNAAKMTKTMFIEKLEKESKGSIILKDFENDCVEDGDEVFNLFYATIQFEDDGWACDSYFDRFYFYKNKFTHGSDYYMNTYNKSIHVKPSFYRKGDKLVIKGVFTLIKSHRGGNTLWETYRDLHTHEVNESDITPLY